MIILGKQYFQLLSSRFEHGQEPLLPSHSIMEIHITISCFPNSPNKQDDSTDLKLHLMPKVILTSTQRKRNRYQPPEPLTDELD